MSQFTYEPLPAEQSNGLAIAGFVCSLLGLFTGFLLSPIGLILSLVALGRPGGRGFAVAGVVIGLLGSCGAIVAVLLVVLLGAGAVLAAVGLGIAMIALAEPEKIELTSDMINIAIAAKILSMQLANRTAQHHADYERHDRELHCCLLKVLLTFCCFHPSRPGPNTTKPNIVVPIRVRVRSIVAV
ncbi:MAG: DUF4190 domain-containing protein [Planctomycetes bacterium]|nr:DUF4190 domain-containing protein [Planctomycetota bacterium]